MRRSVPIIALGLALSVAGCKGKQVRVSASGSSTVYPITEAMAEEFGKVRRDIQVTVGIAGTGGGFKKFCAGETDISDASRPIRPSEVQQCQSNGVRYIEVPVAYDGIVVVVNPRNTWANDITVEELRKLWAPEAQGRITRWSQLREGWPNKEIHLFGPGVDSGTYDYFTEAIVHREHASRGDYTSSENDNVLVQGVANDELALGYFGLSYYTENKDRLKLLAVDALNPARAGDAVRPSLQTVRDGSYQPLSRPIFVYVSVQSLERPEVAAFVDFYLSHGVKLVELAGYVALPERAYELGQARIARRVTGSALGGKGSRVGVSIDELLESEQVGAPAQ